MIAGPLSLIPSMSFVSWNQMLWLCSQINSEIKNVVLSWSDHLFLKVKLTKPFINLKAPQFKGLDCFCSLDSLMENFLKIVAYWWMNSLVFEEFWWSFVISYSLIWQLLFVLLSRIAVKFIFVYLFISMRMLLWWVFLQLTLHVILHSKQTE